MRCIVMVAIYAALNHRDVRGRCNVVNSKLSTAFMSIDKLVDQVDVLEEDDFRTLSQYATNGTMIIGSTGLETSSTLGGYACLRDPSSELSSSTTTWTAIERTPSSARRTVSGDTFYHILLCSTDEDNSQSIEGDASWTRTSSYLRATSSPARRALPSSSSA